MIRRHIALVTVSVVVGTASLSGAQIPPTGPQAGKVQPDLPAQTAAPVADAATDDYVIGADDVLAVFFWRDQQLSGDVVVRPDGKISLPLLDDVQAAGLTPKQLRDRLVIEARRFVAAPVATVVVKQTNSRKAYVIGQVMKPGQYPLTSSMTVLQLIATAGGFQDYAKVKDIRVVRVVNGQSSTFRVDYDEIMKQNKVTQNILLKPADTVIVP